MTHQPSQPLDPLLRQWAARHKPDQAAAERLHGRIMNAARGAAFLDLPLISPARRAAALWNGALWFVLGAAAAVFAVWIFPPCGQNAQPVAMRQDTMPQEQSPALSHWSHGAEFQPSQLADKARLLAGVEELFGGRLAWVAEEGGQVQLGLLDAARDGQPESPGSNSEAAAHRVVDRTGDNHAGDNVKPMAVRVVVLTRKAGSSDWKPLWAADVVTHDEQLVELPPAKTGGPTLRMWTQRLPDGLFAVDCELALSDRLPLHSSFSGVQRGAVPQRIFLLQGDDAEYQVYQTVAPLDKLIEKFEPSKKKVG